MRNLCLEIIFWAGFRGYHGRLAREGLTDPILDEVVSSERKRDSGRLLDGSVARVATFTCDHDGRPSRRGVSGHGSLRGTLQWTCFRQTLQTLRPVIVPDDDFMAVEALQQQIGNTQATRTKEVENINDKLKGKTLISKVTVAGTNYLNENP